MKNKVKIAMKTRRNLARKAKDRSLLKNQENCQEEVKAALQIRITGHQEKIMHMEKQI